jgi:serine/threonine protein kinase
MDRSRLIKEIISKGIPVDGEVLKVGEELGRGGNGVAFRCQDSRGSSLVAKVYIPPDNRDLDERALKRFEHEIKLTTTLRHPNVIRASSSGALRIGAYNLPFYTMPLAPKTLRALIRPWADADDLNQLVRVFLKAARGVIFLHSNGIVHRDLKPENVLISADGTPWVADLGIAHVNPLFVSGSLKTIEMERLLNRDYYAPEQRFGSAVDVDQRADIYALGCIFYELVMGTPPVRNNSPRLGSKDDALAFLDPIFNRMTAFSADDRYQRLEDAIDDLSINFGYTLATMQGGRAAASRDLPTMIKLLRSSNELHRRKGIEIARELGNEALESLHELVGHARRDVRDAAGLALGEIADPSSLHYLVSALYGSSKKASAFRPSSDMAGVAISHYPPELRIRACDEISQPIRPSQAVQILKGLPKDEAYAAYLRLISRGTLLLDWAESEVEGLVALDEDRAWSSVQKLIEEQQEWKLRGVLGHLSPARQAECIRLWLSTIKDSWSFEGILRVLQTSQMPPDDKREMLGLLLARVQAFDGRFRFTDKDKVEAAVRNELGMLKAHFEVVAAKG